MSVTIVPEPLFVLRASFWATGALLNQTLHLYPHHLEIAGWGRRGWVRHRWRYDRVTRLETVPGRLFTDVILRTRSGRELILSGVRNRDLVGAVRFLELSVRGES